MSRLKCVARIGIAGSWVVAFLGNKKYNFIHLKNELLIFLLIVGAL